MGWGVSGWDTEILVLSVYSDHISCTNNCASTRLGQWEPGRRELRCSGDSPSLLGEAAGNQLNTT